jgi:plasmid stabilization system protein ParE
VSRPKYALRLLRAAEDDLVDIVTFVAADNVSAAEALALKIEKSLSSLMNHPNLGRIPEDAELTQLGYRYIIVGNYLIFYVVQGKSIVVHRIIHGARDYRSLL